MHIVDITVTRILADSTGRIRTDALGYQQFLLVIYITCDRCTHAAVLMGCAYIYCDVDCFFINRRNDP